MYLLYLCKQTDMACRDDTPLVCVVLGRSVWHYRGHMQACT